MPPEAGTPVRVAMTKWGDRPHWEYDAVLLGTDEHGEWVGVRAGTPISRPGVTLTAVAHQVVLVPAAGSPAGRWWLATFHPDDGPHWGMPGHPVSVYVDMTTPATWDGTTLRSTDLDLDVVRGVTGRVWVDDEDEFARHRVELGYPDEVAREAVAACEAVRDAMSAGTAPFDRRAHLPWLERAAAGRA